MPVFTLQLFCQILFFIGISFLVKKLSTSLSFALEIAISLGKAYLQVKSLKTDYLNISANSPIDSSSFPFPLPFSINFFPIGHFSDFLSE